MSNQNDLIKRWEDEDFHIVSKEVTIGEEDDTSNSMDRSSASGRIDNNFDNE